MILNSQHGGKITGAGVFIIESYKGKQVITLFGKSSKSYDDPGGKIDNNETPVEAAYRECREETANLIHIKPHELLKIGMRIQLKEYVSFIIHLKNLSFMDYMANTKHIHKKCNRSGSWKETNNMIRVELTHIINSALNGKKSVYDIDGKIRKIRDRTMDIIKREHHAILKASEGNPITLTRQVVMSSRKPCLIGTITYTLKPLILKNQIMPKKIASIPIRKHKYAIYVAPDLHSKSRDFFINCNKTWGGMHVTLTGFHKAQPPLKIFMDTISKSGKKHWTINLKKVEIKKNKIKFKSITLDKIADFLHKNKFSKVKGPKYKKSDWHITSECTIPSNILSMLKNQTWSLVLVRINNDKIEWLERYPLKIL
jgi:hypothetical protein